MKDCLPHSDPENYERRVGQDGRTRAFCKTCKKFIGYVVGKSENKLTAKEKKHGTDVE